MLDLQGALGAKLKSPDAESEDKGSASTLNALGAMLTLSKAKNEYGFDAARAGLTAEEAADLASTFARFDVNGTGKLNSGDLYDLARELGIGLSIEDSQAALNMLDADDNGSVEFSEFVEWYSGVVALECGADGCDPVSGKRSWS